MERTALTSRKPFFVGKFSNLSKTMAKISTDITTSVRQPYISHTPDEQGQINYSGDENKILI